LEINKEKLKDDTTQATEMDQKKYQTLAFEPNQTTKHRHEHSESHLQVTGASVLDSIIHMGSYC